MTRRKKVLWGLLPLALAGAVAAYFWLLPKAEVYRVRRAAVTSAIYGTVRIESTFVTAVRSQNSGYIVMADDFAAGQGALGKEVTKGQVVATITDEVRTRALRQAKADLEGARERAQLELPSMHGLKLALDQLQRLEQLRALNTIPAAEYERLQAEVTRLRDAGKAEQIQRDRDLNVLAENVRKIEEDLGKSEVRAPMDGILTANRIVEGELVSEGQHLFTVSTRRTYVRGQVNEEDVGEVRKGMRARIQLYAYQKRKFEATVSSVLPTGDPETQRYTVLLEMVNPPDNLMPGMTGEMNIIIGQRENVLAVPSRAVLVDQVLVVEGGRIRNRTVEIGFRNIDFLEVLKGLNEGDTVVASDQDLFTPGQRVREMFVDMAGDPKPKP